MKTTKAARQATENVNAGPGPSVIKATSSPCLYHSLEEVVHLSDGPNFLVKP